MVFDNASTDGSASIARKSGAEVIVGQLSQGDALNYLMSRSHSAFTLLLHSDVVLLSDRWFEICRGNINATTALVSPEDIGCGPYSRPFGRGMPESSFMFFDAAQVRRLKVWRRHYWNRIPYLRLQFDFYGDHVTHNIPRRLQAQDLNWQPMLVHVSDTVGSPIYEPPFKPGIWTEELGHLMYGLGNFYSLDGTVTHYHNWYDRMDKDIDSTSTETTAAGGQGFPKAYIKAYTSAFLADYAARRVTLPAAMKSNRQPKAL
jgi:glycosyltransferase involved in cell wall biosynthesis